MKSYNFPVAKQISLGYEMRSVGNIVNNWWHIVTWLIVVISLECIEISNPYAVQQELT